MSKTKETRPGNPTQLTRERWIVAAMHMLGEQGVEAVRIEALAGKLRVTKGSFYWHFKNRDDLLEGMVRAWEEETRVLLADAASVAPGFERLRRLFELVDRHKGRLPDTAMFSWARRDPKIARRVEAVETMRVEFLEQVYRNSHSEANGATDRAMMHYLCFVGWLDRTSRAPKSTPAFRVLSELLAETFAQMDLAKDAARGDIRRPALSRSKLRTEARKTAS
jgi:AcrR family transcriptional regulator